MLNNPGVAVFVFLAIGAMSLFTFLSVTTWAGSRQAERQAYYKGEMMKKIAEMGSAGTNAIDYLREQERIRSARRLAGLKLGGLVNIGLGLGLMLLLHAIVRWLYAVGTIPLFIGIALLVYAFWLSPKEAV